MKGVQKSSHRLV